MTSSKLKDKVGPLKRRPAIHTEVARKHKLYMRMTIIKLQLAGVVGDEIPNAREINWVQSDRSSCTAMVGLRSITPLRRPRRTLLDDMDDEDGGDDDK